MNCEQNQHLLDAYLDGELDLVRNLDIEAHLAECRTCSIVYHNRQTIRSAANAEGLYFRATADFQKRLKRALNEADIVERPFSRRLTNQYWLLVGVAVIAFIFSAGLFVKAALPTGNEMLIDEVLSSHVRSLMADHLEDVVSTDQHTVKPWFDGKLDFSPVVIDLAGDGFPLIGGRLDYVAKRPVAAVVYQRRKHIINLFIWPTAETGFSSAISTVRQGYQILYWVAGGMTYWAVSDVSLSDLQTFVQQLQSAMLLPQSPNATTTS